MAAAHLYKLGQMQQGAGKVSGPKKAAEVRVVTNTVNWQPVLP